MDLSTLDTSELANQGALLELRDPAGNPVLQEDGSPVTLILLGEDSDVVTQINNRNANQFLRGTSGSGQSVTAEMSRTNEINKFAAATVAWSGIVVDGEEVPFSTDAAKGLYRRFPWIRDQVRAFIGDRANFTKASRKS
ncbi:hypothetical protein [Bacteriophage sp. 438212]|nr:hypothetical protein [Bacteriophage sp. 438212]